MKKDKNILVLDLPLKAKLEGAAWATAAGTSAGGLTAKATPFVWEALNFSAALPPEIATVWLSLVAMSAAAYGMSEAISNDLAERHGVVMREMIPPRWDISKLNLF